MRRIFVTVFLTFLISIATCELSVQTKDRFVNAFVNYLNNIPDQKLVFEDGVLLDAKSDDGITYRIDVVVTTSEIHNLDNRRQLQCTGNVLDMGENGVIIPNADHHCMVPEATTRNPDVMLEEVVTDSRTEYEVERRVIQLDNEIQPNNEPTSGEQFIAVPRERPSPCIGCSAHVDPQAAGVTELAQLGVLHLDRHDPNAKHTLGTVLDVERQVQVVNGVRYILTLTVDYNSCGTEQTEGCNTSKPCKISILEKPWVKLPDGSKYRAILSNNCTEQWLYGDEGEVVNQNPRNNANQTPANDSSNVDPLIKVVHNTDVQASQMHEKQLTDQELKNLEQQIIPLSTLNQPKSNREVDSDYTPNNKADTMRHVEQSAAAVPASGDGSKTYLNDDKKKAIDDMLNFFSFAGGFDESQSKDNSNLRPKRSYDNDIKVMSLAERYQQLKSNIHNAKKVYTLGKVLVNHINEMDMEVKTRVLNDIIKAEDEFDDQKHFFYLQVRVVIPCETAACEAKDMTYKICNGIIDDTNNKSPEVLNSICYNESEVKSSFGSVKSVEKNDAVLQKLIKEAINKIESETSSSALKLKTITDANTQRVSGLLTKISLILEYTNCNNTVPTILRSNCTVLRYLGSKICDIDIIERHWLKEKKITYTCINRTVDDSFVGNPNELRIAINDPKVYEIAQEGLEYLESQSNVNNTQKIIEIKSVSTEIIAGLLTKVDFVIGYTDCETGKEININACKMVKTEKPRLCHIEVWERPWLEDGRQIKVTCDKSHQNIRLKRETEGILVGGTTEQDPEDASFKDLAKKSLDKYVTESGVTQTLEVVKVDKVTSQVESGYITRIDFRVAPSENSGDSFKCHSEIWKQPWLKKEDINVTCEANKYSRSKREILREKRDTLPGGETQQDLNDPKYKDLATKSLEKYVSDSGVTQQLQVLTVNKVTTQVVAGSITRIDFTVSPAANSGDSFKCHSEIWKQPWLKKEDINVTCEANKYSRSKREIFREKRDTLPGGETQKDLNDPKYKDLATKSLEKYVSDSGVTQQLQVLTVNKVTTQVVAGSITRIDFTVSPPANSGDSFKCHSEIWEQPWLKKEDINVTCEANKYSRSKREIFREKRDTLPGEETQQDLNDPKYKDLATKSLEKYVSDSGVTQQLQVLTVNKVTTQVVAGSITRIDFTVSPAANSGDSFKCHSEIWEQPWLKKLNINITCEANKYSRTKREIFREKRDALPGGEAQQESDDPKHKNLATSKLRGGITEQDQSDPTYKALASKSLSKYVSDSGVTQPLQVLSVNKVTTQIVAGSITRIDFTVSPPANSGDSFKCHSEIWEQLWINREEINITCEANKYSRSARDILESEIEENLNNRVKRGVFDEKVQDPLEIQYNELAVKSLKKYIEISHITERLRVLSVDRVTTQVKNGTIIKLEFTVSEPKTTEHRFSCHSTIYKRIWAETTSINVSCDSNAYTRRHQEVPESVEEISNDSTHSRKFVSTIKLQQVLGGQTERDPNDPRYQELATKSLEKYVSDSGVTQQLQVLTVHKVTTQVVAGSITRIDFTVSPPANSGDSFKCHSEIWEQYWLKKQNINVTCDTNKYSRTTREINGVAFEENSNTKTHMDGFESKRVKRLAFEEEPQDPDEQRFHELATKSLAKYIRISGETAPLRVLKVDRVTTQISNGTIIHMDFTVSPPSTTKNSFNCHSDILEQIWMEKTYIDVTCRDDTRMMIGGTTNVDPSKPEYFELATKSLANYVSNNGIPEKLQVVSVEKVTTQIVSGSLTRINFTVSDSKNTKDKFKCYSEIWEQVWLNKQDFKVTCEKYSRKKREIPEKIFEENTNSKNKLEKSSRVKKRALDIETPDPAERKYHELAIKSLNKYIRESGKTEPLQVLHVDKVTTQVFNGTIINMDFTVAPLGTSENSFFCHSDILEQIWVDKTYINVTCRQGRTNDPDEYLANLYLQKYVSEAFKDYLKDSHVYESHIIEKLEVKSINDMRTELASGIKTIVNFTVWEKGNSKDSFWCISKTLALDSIVERSTKCETNKYLDPKPKPRTKREVVYGGVVNQNASYIKYQELAEACLKKHLQGTGDRRIHRIVAVENVTTQLVSGKITRLDFKTAPTSCKIDDDAIDDQTCKILHSKVISCHSEVWERPWLKSNTKIIDVTCNDPFKSDEINKTKQFRNKRRSNQQGGQKRQDPTKSVYKKLSEESLLKYLMSKNIDIHHKVTKVQSVLTQSVAGTVYNIDFIASPTTCTISEVDVSTCHLNNSIALYCHSQIWNRPWIKNKKIDITCESAVDNDGEDEEYDDEDVDRRKRSIRPGPGAPLSKNVDDPKYKKLAKEALRKYQKKARLDVIYKLSTIEYVKEQVVAGLITSIDFTISPTVCLRSTTVEENDCVVKKPIEKYKCHAKIKKMVRGSRDITIDCSIPRQATKMKGKVLGARRDEIILNREKRQNALDDDYLDEEVRYYYADRAIADYNSRLPTQNLFKVVSIHDLKRSVNMDTLLVRMYVEIAMTYCMRRGEENELNSCDEIDGINHKLCLVKLAPSPDDELVVQKISITCNDEENFESLTGLSINQLIRESIEEVEKNPEITFKMVRQGEPYVIPSLDYKIPTKINFIAVTTNCTKDIKDAEKRYLKCAIDPQRTGKLCTSNIYFERNSKKVHHIKASCRFPQSFRKRRDISLNPNNATADDKMIQTLVQASLDKLEMSSLHRYKQRVLNINSYSTKITTGKLTTIDFDVGYTNCLKFEWVDDVTTCEFLEHLPRRHCVAEVMERLWLRNGRQIEVNCADDETPLEAHIEFENAANAMHLANEALKHIEAKYPNPRKQKIVRIFSLEKQAIAGLHYRMKVEVGLTDCMALSIQEKCNLLDTGSVNKFCRVNVWLRPWTEQPASYRVVCDYQEGTSSDIYHMIQAEHLFYDFLATYKPDYMNDHSQLKKRFEIFKSNVKRIHELNTHERGTARYAITRFADLSVEEFKSKYLGLDLSLREANHVPMRQASIPKVELPDKFDWRDFDMVTEVKDQGSCGSCWAFSVTGNVEGQWKMKSGKLISLSEQELVDCDTLDKGCNGGLPDNAYRAIEQLGGLETESDYPYEGLNDKCSFNKTLSRVQISGAVNISSNETDMAKWLVQNGPISIGINANAMQFYVAGISHPWKLLCNPNNLDHGVLIVGYGAKDYPLFHKHLPYWTIKNSWGPTWGEQGYYRVYRGDGTCGVNLMASSAVV